MPDALLYAGRINGLAGESGGGKSWLSLYTCAEAIQAGEHVLYIDLEDHADSVVGRLLALGVDRDTIAGRFHYMRPDGPLAADAADHLDHTIVELDIALVVIDSIGELLAIQGVNPNDDDKVASVYRAIPRRLANHGAAVLLVDHVPKSKDASPLYAIGSQRKRAAIDGAAYMVQTIQPFAAGTPGSVKLVTAKDRLGNYPTGSIAAIVDITSDPDGRKITLDVRAPEPAADGHGIRQTINMGRISDWLAMQPGRRANRAGIEHGAGVRKQHVTAVLAQLVAEGCVELDKGGPGRPDFYTLRRPFDATEPADDDF